MDISSCYYTMEGLSELWRGRIMSSENATFVKSCIFNKQFLPVESLSKLMIIILYLQLYK